MYYNNPYAQQSYTPSYSQPVYSQPVYSQPVSNVQSVKVDFNGAIVNSFEDVKTYPVPIGGLVLLLNKNDSKFYLKSLSDNGVPILETYNFSVCDSNIDNASKNKEAGMGSGNADLLSKVNILSGRISDCETKLKELLSK
jgi:hypothetical protein